MQQVSPKKANAHNPPLTVVEEHKECILTDSSKASEASAEANKLTEQCKQELNNTRKEAQSEIANSQKTHKEILEIESGISQKCIDNSLDTVQKGLFAEKNVASNGSDEIV